MINLFYTYDIFLHTPIYTTNRHVAILNLFTLLPSAKNLYLPGNSSTHTYNLRTPLLSLRSSTKQKTPYTLKILYMSTYYAEILILRTPYTFKNIFFLSCCQYPTNTYQRSFIFIGSTSASSSTYNYYQTPTSSTYSAPQIHFFHTELLPYHLTYHKPPSTHKTKKI